MQIHSIEPAQYDAARQLLRDAGWDRGVASADEFAQLLSRSPIALVAIERQLVVGFLRALSDGMTNGYLSMLVVHADWRGRGNGQALLRAAMGDNTRMTWVLRARPDAAGFYGRLGFADSQVALERPGTTARRRASAA
jgi:ribosomal protein S18 acetylase RimI-like enzyme